MAEILPFRRAGLGRRQRPGTGRHAEIVIFPGIRVEYHGPSVRPDLRLAPREAERQANQVGPSA
ncbi:hypothetical protein [Propylenella binzhouense]|uniref:Uncharacterized protein n=1 Tax=Propylenella binzhouense TaxID=2555902 RepID=A0A964T9E8_9HYPH|nr:hypothetical protein [Propylenella binzhouense]MYZ50485.1 hypothetical protein [Propylenella binzhouense]